ncbi:class I SAM-dependent methyltransferase [Catellatospora paridis]|uniref:class I SAM-dependent methyltransferase n=1 Tax=Catellatospora paridis TaxID=1617086 RepID=UPI0018AF945B|nr:class I SAM-dependent methyltransferase [Catellatospora paridis]
MQPEPDFAANLYQGTAERYDQFRLHYPRVLIQDLAIRAQPSRHGRLLDLACGTGQLAFALADLFAVTWAVDQEPDMVRVVKAKAARYRHNIQAIISSVEELSAGSAAFELITIGNAFHRLRRDQVARHAIEWLRPSGHLALCWSSSPWAGHAAWQKALSEVLDQWASRLNSRDRLPQGWAAAREATPARRAITAIVGSSLRLPRPAPPGIVPVTGAVYVGEQNRNHSTSSDATYHPQCTGVGSSPQQRHAAGILALTTLAAQALRVVADPDSKWFTDWLCGDGEAVEGSASNVRVLNGGARRQH